MALTKEEVRHIAKLARLSLSEEEVEKFTLQFEGIFTHLDTLLEVNTDGVEPTAQVTNLKNVMGEDLPAESVPRDAMLQSSGLLKQQGMIRVRKSI